MITPTQELNTLIAQKIFSDPAPVNPPNFCSDISQACTAIYKVVDEYNRAAFLNIEMRHGILSVKVSYITGSVIFEVKAPQESSLSEALCRCALGAKK